MDKLVVRLSIDYKLMFCLFKDVVDLLSDLQIKFLKLSNPNTRGCSWIILNVFDLSLLLFGFIVHLNIVVDCKYFGKSSFIQHFVNPLGHHIQQFLLIWISHPKYQRIGVSQVCCKLLVAAAYYLTSCYYPLQKLGDSVLIIAVSFESHQLIVLD